MFVLTVVIRVIELSRLCLAFRNGAHLIVGCAMLVSAAHAIAAEQLVQSKDASLAHSRSIDGSNGHARSTEKTAESAVDSEPVVPNSETILVLGDSLSAAYGLSEEQGWVKLLEHRILSHERLASEYRVVNASISGETSAGGLRRAVALLDKWKPAILILELGGNDGLRGVAAPQIEKNLATIIELAQKASADVLLLGMHIPPNYGSRYTEAFHQIFFTLSERYSISLVSFLLENVATREDWMQADGIHPTSEAQQTMLENVWPKLEKLLRVTP